MALTSTGTPQYSCLAADALRSLGAEFDGGFKCVCVGGLGIRPSV